MIDKPDWCTSVGHNSIAMVDKAFCGVILQGVMSILL